MTHVVTLTFSPALDTSTQTDSVSPTHKLRCTAAVDQPGGGGVNVARVAVRLGTEAVAVVPLGGPTGALVGDLLRAEGITFRPVDVAASTRQSFSVTEQSTGDQFRFVLAAPGLSTDEIDALLDETIRAARDAGCLVISGQVPDDVPADVFERLVAAVAPTPVIVDTSGPALGHALVSGAALVKPSARELSTIVGADLLTELEILDAARTVHAGSTVDSLVVSIGAGGAFAIGPGRTARRFRGPSVRVRSAIGAGDSMVAGIAVAISRGDDRDESIALGIAAGAATVLTDGSDLCSADDVHRLRPLVTIEDGVDPR